jgi:hypothetical protein
VLARLDSTDATAQTYLQQRGIEGVIAIDSALAQITNLPAAAVDLTCLTSPASSNGGAQSWLSALGKSAADSVICQIENKTATSPKRVEPKQPAGYFAPASADRVLSGASARNHFAAYGD